jgi:DNA (cytosine-5)-methyltransferase 1
MTLTVGSLFSGIGGIDLGLERAGMNVIWQSEIDPFACKVLKKHWPEVPNHGDIKEINWHTIKRPDIICGGYPCQPFSTAGKRRGNQDPRHLWPWVRHAISQLRPRYAIMENVRGHLSMGGTDVLSDLAGIGYDAEWRVISAASVGANHKRDRVIIVAYPTGELGDGFNHYTRNSPRPEEVPELGNGRWSSSVADPDGCDSSDGRQRKVISSEDRSRRDDRGGSGSDTWEVGVGSTRQSKREMANSDARETSGWFGGVSENSRLVFGRDNIGRGTQSYAGWQWWETEPDVGRVAYGVSDRVDRLKGLGNAVVPQVAEIVGRLVMEAAEQ